MRRQMQKRPRQATDGHTPQPGSTFPAIQETVLPLALIRAQLAGQMEADTHAYRMGDVSILISKEPGMGWHMSIAHPSRYPTWDEVAHLRYRLLPDAITMAMLLPPHDQYINIHQNCFQLWQVGGPR